MRISARAVIIQDGKVLTMFRRKTKDGIIKEYYVIPGGGQENNQTLEETAIRELKEEMNVDIKILGYLGKETWNESTSNYFHCEIVKGTPHLGGEEVDRMNDNNYYEPRFIDLSLLDSGMEIIGTEFIRKAERKEYTKIKSC